MKVELHSLAKATIEVALTDNSKSNVFLPPRGKLVAEITEERLKDILSKFGSLITHRVL